MILSKNMRKVYIILSMFFIFSTSFSVTKKIENVVDEAIMGIKNIDLKNIKGDHLKDKTFSIEEIYKKVINESSYSILNEEYNKDDSSYDVKIKIKSYPILNLLEASQNIVYERLVKENLVKEFESQESLDEFIKVSAREILMNLIDENTDEFMIESEVDIKIFEENEKLYITEEDMEKLVSIFILY